MARVRVRQGGEFSRRRVGAAMRALIQSGVRVWLEALLPLYAVAFLIVWFRPQYMPVILSQSLTESVVPWLVWSGVGAMLGVLILSGAAVAFFLLYSPVYLFNKSLMLFGKAGWVDKRELSFYVSCFVLLCLLIFLALWAPDAAWIAFVAMAGCGPVLWRVLV
jgi:hypothetical protein